MIDNLEARCEHIVHENGIHELILRNMGRAARMHIWNSLSSSIKRGQTSKNPLLVLLNGIGGNFADQLCHAARQRTQRTISRSRQDLYGDLDR